jgi:hypothetical protein
VFFFFNNTEKKRKKTHLAVFEHALDDAAAIRVGREREHLALERVENKLQRVGRHALNALLHHVVPMLVRHALPPAREYNTKKKKKS